MMTMTMIGIVQATTTIHCTIHCMTVTFNGNNDGDDNDDDDDDVGDDDCLPSVSFETYLASKSAFSLKDNFCCSSALSAVRDCEEPISPTWTSSSVKRITGDRGLSESNRKIGFFGGKASGILPNPKIFFMPKTGRRRSSAANVET